MSRRASGVVAVVVVLGVGTGAARADGGRDVASARLAPFGVEQAGSTASGPARPFVADGCAGDQGAYASYWRVPVLDGDVLNVFWSSPRRLLMQLLPVGVSDANAATTRPTLSRANDTGDEGGVVVAPAEVSGTQVIRFLSPECSGAPGPYRFTVRVVRAATLGFPAGHLTGGRTGVIPVSVARPDGRPVSSRHLRVRLQVARGQAWRTIGSAPVANGTARVRYALEAGAVGHAKELRAVAVGTAWVHTTAVKTLHVNATP